MYRKITMISIIIAGMMLIMAFLRVLIFPEFHMAAVGMCFLAGILTTGPAYLKKHFTKAITGTILSVISCLLLYFILIIAAPREGHQEFSSPDGIQTIIIEYDHASRPSLYLKHGIFMKKIKTPKFPGTWEVLTYSIEWVTENEVLLSAGSQEDLIYISWD